MKKFILVGFITVVTSISSFAKEPAPPKPRLKEHIDLVKLDLKKPERDRIIETMPKELGKQLQLMQLDIEQKELNLRKLFLNEPIDWKKVEEENKQIAISEAMLKTQLQKFLIEKGTEVPPVPPVPPKPLPKE